MVCGVVVSQLHRTLPLPFFEFASVYPLLARVAGPQTHRTCYTMLRIIAFATVLGVTHGFVTPNVVRSTTIPAEVSRCKVIHVHKIYPWCGTRYVYVPTQACM